MDDESQFASLLSTLDTSIDTLETNLEPLTSQPLSELTGKLPLLERAKLYTLTTYAILSLIFSTLRLNDIDAKAHPVFKELTRCKEYFDKIKAAETAQEKKEEKNRLRLDKEAAARFIKRGTEGNEQRLREMAEARERARGAVKRKADALDEAEKAPAEPEKAPAAQDAQSDERKVEKEEVAHANPPNSVATKKKSKKSKGSKKPKSSKDVMEGLLRTSEEKEKKKSDRKARRAARKEKKAAKRAKEPHDSTG